MSTPIYVYNFSGYPFERKTAGASGFDLHVRDGWGWRLEPGRRTLVPVGIHLAMPPGVEAQVRPRSGMTLKHGVMAALGTVDADFRGEIGVTLFNFSDEPFSIASGDRIAQLVFAPVILPDFGDLVTPSEGPYHLVVVDGPDKLPPSARGAAGWGSTGR